MALHAHPIGARGEAVGDLLPRLELVADKPWTEVGAPPADCTWDEYSRSVYHLVRDYFDERQEPAAVEDRHARAIRAARIGLLDAVYEREDAEMAIASGMSIRSIGRYRADLRAAA